MQREFTVFKKHIFYSRFLVVMVAVLVGFGLLGCCSKDEPNQVTTEFTTGIVSGSTGEADEKPSIESVKMIGLMVTPQGLNDQGFNDSAYRGLIEAEEKFNISTTIIEPSTWQDPEQSLRFFAKQQFDVIIVAGLGFNEAIDRISKENPSLHFCVIDSNENRGNVQGVAFREEEGAFLCGYLGAKLSKTNKLGFVGGVKIPVIERFKAGYEAGAKYANPETQVITKYVAKDFSGFNNVDKARDVANNLYLDGCDVILPAAGASTLGVIDSAKENDKYVFGIDNNQDALAPGLVLTSLVKRVDKVVEIIVEAIYKGKKEDIMPSYGLSNEALSLTDFELTKEVVGEELIKELESLKKDIVSGKINPLLKAD